MCLGARPRWFATRSSCPYGVCSQPRGGSRPRRNVGAKGSQNDKSRPVIETAFGEGRYSANDSVGPFPRFRPRGFDLDHVPADKPANAVILPVGRLCDLSQRRAFPALHQFQDSLGLAAGSAAIGLVCLRGILRLPGRRSHYGLLAGFRLLRARGLRRRFLCAHRCPFVSASDDTFITRGVIPPVLLLRLETA